MPFNYDEIKELQDHLTNKYSRRMELLNVGTGIGWRDEQDGSRNFTLNLLLQGNRPLQGALVDVMEREARHFVEEKFGKQLQEDDLVVESIGQASALSR